MNIVIQIPCLNEALTLPVLLDRINRLNLGHATFILVADDNSTDSSASHAEAAQVARVLRNTDRQGLGSLMQKMLISSLELKADIIVNIDADLHYSPEDIPNLLKPILDGRADVVLGCRQFSALTNISGFKRFLYWAGGHWVSLFVGLNISDPVTGFRALKAEVARNLVLDSSFTYTLTHLIQFRRLKCRVTCVQIRPNEVNRPSRLISSTSYYLAKQFVALASSFIKHRVRSRSRP